MRTTAAWGVLLLMAGSAALCRGAVKVQSPNGGESFPAQSRRLITWSCDAGVQQATVEFSFTGGIFWDVVASAVPCVKGQGSYLWTVPPVSSPRCLIRVTGSGPSGGSDQSDAFFTVFPCTLRMDYDGDCRITMADFAAFAQEWLRCGDPYDPRCSGNRPPQIVSSPPAPAGLGQVYAYTVRAVDPDGDGVTYELLRGPPGMVIHAASGRITWTVTGGGPGTLAVIVQVRDDWGAADVQAFDLASPGAQTQPIFTGAPAGGYPSLRERQVLVYTNAVRMAPQQYRDKYMTGYQPNPSSILRSHTVVEPLYYESRLNQSARFHAQDMGANGCFQHDSCNGASWSGRIWSFYPQARAIGENIAAGYPTAKAVVDGWLCDSVGGQCAQDRTPQAGHRTSIMSGDFATVGMGYAPDTRGTWRHFWVQDFASNEPASKPPLVAGCHDFLVGGTTSFLLNYRDPGNRPPVLVQVVLEGVPHSLALDLGAPAAGTYRLDVTRAGACRSYYFLAVTAAGQTWRYPGPGAFLTAGEGACTEEYRE